MLQFWKISKWLQYISNDNSHYIFINDVCDFRHLGKYLENTWLIILKLKYVHKVV